MNYHLYFHDDFDGMSSSAILLDFFRTRGDDIASFNPINFDSLSEIKDKVVLIKPLPEIYPTCILSGTIFIPK